MDNEWDVRQAVFEARMERMGLKKCESCLGWFDPGDICEDGCDKRGRVGYVCRMCEEEGE